MDFKRFFLEEEEEERNLKATLAKLPDGHRALVKGFKFRYQPGNTLRGDDKHIGVIDKDTITVAAPWNYSRCFTTLHELAHLIWEKKMPASLREEWKKLFVAHKEKQKSGLPEECRAALDQNAEEIFCMVYSTAYSKHPVATYNNQEWTKFIKNRVPN